MVIEFISPFIEGAFSEPILHRVVLSKIDFELRDEDWEEIESGFAYYWDEEAGLGNYVDAESAFFQYETIFSQREFCFQTIDYGPLLKRYSILLNKYLG